MRSALLPLCALALLLQGCGMTMPRYEPNYANVEVLRAAKLTPQLDQPHVEASSGQNRLFVRANPISSPSGDMAAHLRDALEGELRLAGLLEPGAARRLEARLEENELNAALFGQGHGVLVVEFRVVEGDRTLYQGTKRVENTWDSSFIGALAIPRAANAYNPMVTRALGELYRDPAFIAALRR